MNHKMTALMTVLCASLYSQSPAAGIQFRLIPNVQLTGPDGGVRLEIEVLNISSVPFHFGHPSSPEELGLELFHATRSMPVKVARRRPGSPTVVASAPNGRAVPPIHIDAAIQVQSGFLLPGQKQTLVFGLQDLRDWFAMDEVGKYEVRLSGKNQMIIPGVKLGARNVTSDKIVFELREDLRRKLGDKPVP